MTTKHTPGPWEVRMKDIVYAGERLIADCEQTPHALRPAPCNLEDEANARLIAEAGTVAAETGLTPRQMQSELARMEQRQCDLVSERDELLEALLDLRKAFYVDGKRSTLLAAFEKTHAVLAKGE